MAKENEFIITRVFDAPRDLVWKAHAESERLAQWWGPKGFSIRVVKLDFRPGGIFHYCMVSPGNEMWGRFIYREIVPQERIVFINSFSDKEGNITRPPFSEIWPLEILNTITLTEHESKTTLTLRSAPINATEEERKTFDTNFEGMNKGYTGTFDKLSDYLKKA